MRKMNRYTGIVVFTFIIIFLSFFAGTVRAESASITGSVRDGITNVPIANVKVSVYYSGNNTLVAFNFTDNIGEYRIENLPPGQYIVIFEAEGYYNFSWYVEILEGETHDLDVFLDPFSGEKGVLASEGFPLILICYQGGLIITIALVVSLVMYSKIKRDNLLNNAIRKRILDHIKENPGKHYRAILNDLNLSMGVLSYHLNILEKGEFIKSRQDGMYRRFYITGPKTEMRFFLSEIQEKILNEIRENRGISQSNIARKIGASRVVVNYHINILNQAGFIFVENRGRETACYIR